MMNSKIKDERPRFIWLWAEVLTLGLSPIELAVYCHLVNRADKYSLTCFPGHKKIATDARCSPRAVQDALKELRTKRLIKITQRIDEDGQHSNLYTILRTPRT